jgi:hypothetical protein
VGASHTRAALQKKQKAHQKNVEVQKASKATSPENDRFKAIRTATMGDVEIADEGVPRSAYELQALAIHAKDQALIAAEVVPRSGYERQAWRYMPKTRLW